MSTGLDTYKVCNCKSHVTVWDVHSTYLKQLLQRKYESLCMKVLLKNIYILLTVTIN